MEGLRKVLNVLQIENNNMLQPCFYECRDDFESVAFFAEEFWHKRIQKEDGEKKDAFVDITATMNIPEDAVKQYGSLVALK